MQRSYYGAMGLLKRMIPFFISVAITPILFLVGTVTAMEGDIFYMNLVLPYIFLSLATVEAFGGVQNFVESGWALPAILTIATLQFPVYGLIISFIKDRPPAIIKLFLIHIFAAGLSFYIYITYQARPHF